MNAVSTLNVALILVVLGLCLSLITSRQQQRLDYTAWVRAQNEGKRLDQDYTNLRNKQQQLEKTDRIERIARKQLDMERAPSGRVDYVKSTPTNPVGAL